MIYLDTNVLIYAFCKNVDNLEQKKHSQEILKSAIASNKLLLSEIVLYEFAFVSLKLKESNDVVKMNLDFLSKYIKSADVHSEAITLMSKISSYKHSFDTYHIYFNCSELVTFDSGFKQFCDYSKTKITIV